MIHHAEKYEEYVRARNTYRPPPLPSLALVPETAYYAKKKFDKSHEAQNPLKGRTKWVTSFMARRTIRKDGRQKLKLSNLTCKKRNHMLELTKQEKKEAFFSRMPEARDLSVFLLREKDGGREGTTGSPESQPKKLKTTPKDGQSWLRTIPNFSVSVESSRNMDSRPHIEIEIYGSTFSALIDTGATVSMVGKSLAEHLRRNWNVPFKRPMKIRMADDSQTLLEEYCTFEGLICYRDTMHTFGGVLRRRLEEVSQLVKGKEFLP
ncbi:hypothetical protein J6590_084491 [Homalodisca vitripennis]|nr:hypothetical protein J6590_084491 [Homalodisca vitripennis]